MVADQHWCAFSPGLSDSTATVGQHHDLCAGGGRGANTVNHSANTVAFVVVGARTQNQCKLSVR